MLVRGYREKESNDKPSLPMAGLFTATVLQRGWYGSVRSGRGDATAAGYSASVSHILTRNDTLQDSYKPTRSEQVSGSSLLVGSRFQITYAEYSDLERLLVHH